MAYCDKSIVFIATSHMWCAVFFSWQASLSKHVFSKAMDITLPLWGIFWNSWTSRILHINSISSVAKAEYASGAQIKHPYVGCTVSVSCENVFECVWRWYYTVPGDTSVKQQQQFFFLFGEYSRIPNVQTSTTGKVDNRVLWTLLSCHLKFWPKDGSR